MTKRILADLDGEVILSVKPLKKEKSEGMGFNRTTHSREEYGIEFRRDDEVVKTTVDREELPLIALRLEETAARIRAMAEAEKEPDKG